MKHYTVYFRRLPKPLDMAKLRQRFLISGVTVNGIAHATVLPGDEDVFQKCIDMGFFEIRNIVKPKNLDI